MISNPIFLGKYKTDVPNHQPDIKVDVMSYCQLSNWDALLGAIAVWVPFGFRSSAIDTSMLDISIKSFLSLQELPINEI